MWVPMWYVASSSCGVAREKGLFCSCFDNCADTMCLFPENCTNFEYVFHIKMFVDFSYLIFFDQDRHSCCPGTSCYIIFFLSLSPVRSVDSDSFFHISECEDATLGLSIGGRWAIIPG